MSRKKLISFLVPVLVLMVGALWMVREGDAAGIQAKDQPAAEIGAKVLPGTWVWAWAGEFGGKKTTIVTTFKIDSVAENGRVQGTTTIKVGDNDPWEGPFSDKARVYTEDGTLRFRVERISDGERFVYDLMPNKNGASLDGSFSRSDWSNDKIKFLKQ